MKIFDYLSSSDYLSDWAKNEGRGAKSKLARTCRCENSHISNILAKKTVLSLEQASLISRLVGFSETELEYFLDLVNFERAAEPGLRNYFKVRLDRSRRKNLNICAHVETTKNHDQEFQSVYFSSWRYPAVHLALGIPDLQNSATISKRLGIPQTVVDNTIADLVRIELVTKSKDGFNVLEDRVHYSDQSTLISHYHRIWRSKCLASLDTPHSADLHYSSVISISRPEMDQLKSLLIGAIKESKEITKKSSAEHLFGICVDAFSLDAV